ncbi:NAD(P)H-dependent oxidoreductase [Candidatus Kaiserbacteria bacterium]|nr:NAD(P)H-dependent oxidoreductase [Candidatus Kaiserbacteria bacterium]
MGTKIIGIVGSLREKSINRGLMNAFKDSAPEGVELEIAQIDNLPLYSEDLDKNYPESALQLKSIIESADALIIATPEYNRSVSGVLKNAIDVASRPAKSNSFDGKPVLVISASPGGAGGAMAQYHLKQTLLHLNMTVIGQPEFWVGGAGDKFNEDGALTDENTKKFIEVGWGALLKEVK